MYKIKISKLNPYYLIIILPLLLVTGPLLADSCLVILSLYFIYKNNLEIKKYFNNEFLFRILIYFFSYNVLVSLFAEDIFLSLKSSITHFRFIIFAFVFVYIFENFLVIRKMFFWFLFYTVLLVSIDATIQFYLEKNLLGWTSQSGGRVSGLFGTEYILGSYLSKMLPLLISLKIFLEEKNEINLNRYLYLFNIAISFFAIIFSGERVSIFSITLFISVYILFINNQDIRKKIILIGAFIFVSFITIYSSEQLRERIIYLTLGNLSFLSEEIDINKISEKTQYVNPKNIHQNVKHLLVAKEIFKENPIFGNGNKMFGKICFERYFVDDGRCSTHPHNFLTQVLVENGIIGAIFYLSIFFYIFKIFISNFFSKQKKSKSLLSISCLSLIILMPIIPSGNFFNNWLNINIFLILSFLIFLKLNQSSILKKNK